MLFMEREPERWYKGAILNPFHLESSRKIIHCSPQDVLESYPIRLCCSSQSHQAKHHPFQAASLRFSAAAVWILQSFTTTSAGLFPCIAQFIGFANFPNVREFCDLDIAE